VKYDVRRSLRPIYFQKMLRVGIAQTAEHVGHLDAKAGISVVQGTLHGGRQAPLDKGYPVGIHRVCFNALELFIFDDFEVSFLQDVADILNKGFERNTL